MHAAGKASYRVWQFWQALKAKPLSPETEQEIAALLSVKEIELFKRQSVSGQQHAYRVMRALRQAEYEERPLLAAALLHDVGKTKVRSRWWDKPLVVLSQAFLKPLTSGWTHGEARGWRRPFVVKACHAAWGAEMAQSAGSCPLTVALIGAHQDEPGLSGDRLIEKHLVSLRWADNSN